METHNLPKTIAELEKWMIESCYNFNSYSLKGNVIDEGYGIEINEGNFVWYYTERGQKDILKRFQSENEMAAYAYNHIKEDKWAKSYCIAVSSDKNQISELKKELKETAIEFLEDEIPFQGFDLKASRIFVFGCDIHKTAHLKEKYWTK